MRVGVYARVSTTRQAHAQTIEQQLDLLRAAVAGRGWVLDEQHVYRDDGYSGARLGRPGLDRLRDHAALADLDVVAVTAPDRLARNYVHQVLLLEELAGHGCRVEFLDRPMSSDPHDQLLLQIRGAVAEYERTLIAERMRRGRQAKLQAGTLLPWTRPPFGYRLDPERPRQASAVRVEPGEAVLVAQLFDWYLQPQATVYRLARRLTDPAQLTRALRRARGGAWLPQELQARQAAIRQALGQLERQQQRLLDAYLAEVIALAELDRKRQDLDRRHATLLAQQRQLDAAAGQRLELRVVTDGIEAFCRTVRAGLATATFEQRRQLAELLIDRVIVTGDQVEIRYVLPTSPDGPHRPFCQLRKDHLGPVPDAIDAGDLGQVRRRVRAVCLARAAGAGQVGDQVPGGLVRQGARVGGGHNQAGEAVRSPPAQRRVGGVPGLGVPVPEGPGHRLPFAGIGGPVPGQRARGVRGSVGIGAVSPGAVAGFEGHHERQPGLGELAAEPVLVPVRAVGGHRAEHEPRGPGPDRQVRADRQLGAERRIALALREMLRRGV